jgi:DeoR/GlpR family transcriptional regulator of sugar metabolism
MAERLQSRGTISVTELEREFEISPMTVRRDLAELERQGILRRIHGGAILPGMSGHEDSFYQRLQEAVDDKERLAEAAIAALSPGDAVFVDCSTTAYFAARRLIRENFRCTLLTNAPAVIQLVCESDSPQVDLIGFGGLLRKLTRSLVGPQAVAGIESHFADKAILSVSGLTESGEMTDPDPMEAEVKHAMIRRSRRSILLLDRTKFDSPALSVVGPVSEVSAVLATRAPASAVALLRASGVEVQAI